jgi:Rab3 GTPase-activating protein non-catalytic subunit
LFSDKSWLNGCFIQFYDILVICYGSKFIIYQSSRYDKEQQYKVFSDMKKMQIDENQIITSCVIFPISGGTNYLDWTCIAIGLSTGNVQFYSENGSLLYEKELCNEQILSIKISAYEEMVAFYFQSCIIVYQMNHLVSLLKSLKEVINKAKNDKANLVCKDFMLSFKKWDYKRKDMLISDALMISQQKNCLFDHLLTESLEMGFTKKFRITPYRSFSLIATGSRPFLHFHSAREGFKQHGVLTDVAKAVVNKLTSHLP